MAQRSKRSKPKPKSKAGQKKSSLKNPRSVRGTRSKRGKKRTSWIRRSIVGVIVVGFVIAVVYSYLTTERDYGKSSVHKEADHPYTTGKVSKRSSDLSPKSFQTIRQTKKSYPREHPYHQSTKEHSAASQPSKRQRETTVHKQHHKEAEKREIKHRQKTILMPHHTKAKLVIIIDDVHTRAQLAAIRTLPFPVTPSIFPPYRQAKHSNLLAKGLKHYMIHLPMESGSAQFNSQTKTLMTSFSESQMRDRIRELRRLFPTAVYINNHTGSIFTSDYRAMKQLYDLLKTEGFVFVDSYTVASSKVKQIASEEGDRYVKRSVFIDNRQNIAYIHEQLKKAVAIAKKRGYAVVIGHPHPKTLQALREAKPILKDVDVVYIDALYRSNKRE